MNEKLIAEVERLGPWFHQIDLGDGVRTRDIHPMPGPQPRDHPLQRWEAIRDVVPADLAGKRVLDIGCADGFFSFELARRGARVVAVDLHKSRVGRLNWAARKLGLRRVEARTGSIYELEALGRFDCVLVLALLYHLRDPLAALVEVGKVTDEVFIESACVPDDENATLHLARPAESHPGAAKFFPTTKCVDDMLQLAGFDEVVRIDDPNAEPKRDRVRAYFHGRRSGRS